MLKLGRAVMKGYFSKQKASCGILKQENFSHIQCSPELHSQLKKAVLCQKGRPMTSIWTKSIIFWFVLILLGYLGHFFPKKAAQVGGLDSNLHSFTLYQEKNVGCHLCSVLAFSLRCATLTREKRNYSFLGTRCFPMKGKIWAQMKWLAGKKSSFLLWLTRCLCSDTWGFISYPDFSLSRVCMWCLFNKERMDHKIAGEKMERNLSDYHDQPSSFCYVI